MARTTARVDGATLVLPERDASPIAVDTAAWFAWLEQATTFAFTSSAGHFTARKERQARSDGYRKAYRTSHGALGSGSHAAGGFAGGSRLLARVWIAQAGAMLPQALALLDRLLAAVAQATGSEIKTPGAALPPQPSALSHWESR